MVRRVTEARLMGAELHIDPAGRPFYVYPWEHRAEDNLRAALREKYLQGK